MVVTWQFDQEKKNRTRGIWEGKERDKWLPPTAPPLPSAGARALLFSHRPPPASPLPSPQGRRQEVLRQPTNFSLCFLSVTTKDDDDNDGDRFEEEDDAHLTIVAPAPVPAILRPRWRRHHEQWRESSHFPTRFPTIAVAEDHEDGDGFEEEEDAHLLCRSVPAADCHRSACCGPPPSRRLRMRVREDRIQKRGWMRWSKWGPLIYGSSYFLILLLLLFY